MKFLRFLRSIAEVAELPSGLMTLCRSRPRSIASLKIAHSLKLAGCDFRTIFDGGANIGQFARAVSTVFPNATIHSFEPLPDMGAQFKKNLKDIGARVHLHPCALGSVTGELTIRRCSASQSSSALPIQRRGDNDLLANVQETDQIRVPLRTLDEIWRSMPHASPILLKLDLQGYELEALKGAEEMLAATDCVLIESVFKQAYVGEPLFEEVWEFLRQRNFQFKRPLSFVSESSGEIVQIDALFERREKNRQLN